jgi:hypothetical protein
MLVLRKLFFYIFLIIYLIACPLIVFYAFGFILKPDTQEPIVKTGLIYLSTVPPGASIYLNNESTHLKTPIPLQELDPADYTVKLSMDNYLDWSHDITVAPNKACVFDKILLIPKKREAKLILNEKFENLIPLTGMDFFVLRKSPALKDWIVYYWKDDKRYPLLGEEPDYGNMTVSAVHTIGKSGGMLFYLNSGTGRRYLYVEPDREKPFFKDITELFTTTPERVAWDPSQPRQIFTFQKEYLNMIDITNEAVYPRYITNVTGFGFLNKKIYVLDNDYVLTRTNLDKGSVEVLLDDKRIGEMLFAGKGFFNILPVAESIILFISEKGELITNHLPYRFTDDGVEGSSFYEKNRKLLLWEKKRIGIVDFLTEVIEGITFEKGPELLWVDVKAGNIKQAFWVYEDSHILFRDKAQTWLIEMEETGRPHLDALIKVNAETSLFYTEDTGTLYYLGSASSKLYSLDIIGQKPLREKEQ